MQFPTLLSILTAWATSAGVALAACPGYTACPAVDYPAVLKSARARAVMARIDAREAQAVHAADSKRVNFGQLVAYIGEALVYDRTLSVRASEACALCHGEGSGFAGGLPAFTPAAGVFPGAVTWRTGPRAPQSLAYAAFAPVLTFRPDTQDFAGGNFWDSRATGLITGSPAADQAMVPLTSPFEMALPDVACAVWHVAQAPYSGLFADVWGGESLSIDWPKNTASVCARPNDGGTDQTPLHLSQTARARAVLTAQQIGLTIETFEASWLASRFSSTFDAVQAGRARFTPAQQRGYALFTGRAKCAACHTAAGQKPLFTDFTSANLGVPRNNTLPFLNESLPDGRGYIANPVGPSFVDAGLGGFLASAADTNPQWQAQATRFIGAFQVPTLRNIARGKHAYMHNGYFTDLPTLVHFLNTRDVLPWPKPEIDVNVNRSLTGSLGLSPDEEADIVAFLGTLSD